MDGKVVPLGATTSLPLPERICEVGRVLLQRRLVQLKLGLPDLDDDGTIGMPEIWMLLRVTIAIALALARSRPPGRRPLVSLGCVIAAIVRGPIRSRRLALLACVGLAATITAMASSAPPMSRPRRLAPGLIMTRLLSSLAAFLRL